MEMKLPKNFDPLDHGPIPKPKKVRGKIKEMKATPYKGSMVYLRHIPLLHIFEYLLVYQDQIYTAHSQISPKVGKTKLTKNEINQCAAMMYAAATTTIDTLIERDTMNGNDEKSGTRRGF